jgi:transcriptional regulator with PAS, ATPase and Fis domain
MAGFVASETVAVPTDDPHNLHQRHAGLVAALRVKGSTLSFRVGDDGWRAVLGSRPSCDLWVDDPCVSGQHCVLERRGRALTVRDRDSKNGTFINGTPVEAAVLRPGHVLTVGRTSLVAIADGAAERRTAFQQLRGSDPRFRTAVDQAVQVGATDHTVLIVGETGTGKELFASAIHEASRRAMGPFVAVNCGGIPPELVASELFGHERGAFTGAVGEREGYFVQADGGTLFLDELGELPIEHQPHLLRALETRRVRRVGGTAERPVDVRIIAATNRLSHLGTGRSRIRVDLYHRLSTVVLPLPPLRDRLGDLREIIDGWLEESGQLEERERFGDEAWAAMYAYGWPGNIRELRQAVSRALSFGGAEIRPRDLFPDLAVAGARRRWLPSGAPAVAEPLLPPYEAAQRDVMREALARHRSIRAASAAVGMPKSTFAEKAQRYGLETHRLRPMRGRR